MAIISGWILFALDGRLAGIRSLPSSFDFHGWIWLLASQLSTFVAVTLLSRYIVVTFATTCMSNSRDFASAILGANIGYTLQSLACGHSVQSCEITVQVWWLK